MPTLRQTVLGLVALGFGLASAASTTTPVWAEGVGPRIKDPPLQYSPDEDEEDGATSQPDTFNTTPQLSYAFSKGMTNFRYVYPEPEEEKYSSFTLSYSDTELNWSSGIRVKLEYRLDSFDEQEEEPNSTTTSDTTLEYKFNTRISLDALEAVDEDPLHGLDPEKYVWDEEEGLGLKVGGYVLKLDMSPEAARSFQEWYESKTVHDRVREWLGDDAFDSLQQQFGDWGPDFGGVDFTSSYSF